MGKSIIVWSGGLEADGWLSRRKGQFLLRKNPAHVDRCVNIINQRIENESDFRYG